jgi:flagellar basal-body rod protein FlgG
MPKGVYAAASAMVTETRALESVAKNLAHVQTPGYRKETALRDSFAQVLAGQGRAGSISRDGGAGVVAAGTYHAFTQGALEQTHAPLDLAIAGEGFYRVRDPQGALALTRAGHFATDGDGRLVTDDGWAVEGQAGPVLIPPETSRVIVDESGRVYSETRDENGSPSETFIDQLRVVTVAEPSAMRPRNGTYFDPGDQAQTDATSEQFDVRQGWLEKANIDPVQELVSMITIQRRYDAAQRAMRQQDEAGRGFSDLLRGA